MKPLPKNYDHTEAEPRLQKHWEDTRVHAWEPAEPRENTFVIDTPPPTVSGVLHMGHIFSYTQADFVARFQRMSGKTVFYPMGFDDNGLPTERLVEKEKKVRGSAMPREEFVALCREVVKSAEGEFRTLFKGVALSVDWAQEYQTISDDVRKLSQMSFLDLLGKGEAYRDFRPTYWDWVDQTAIAQAEIENKEMPGVMNEILFALEDGWPLHIATTRPELLGACVAVMYHKDDERYNGEGVKKGIPNSIDVTGKVAITPAFGVKVPMIADEAVEQGKGTGLVMCCTFGDDTDKEWQRKHGFPRRTILDVDGKIKIMWANAHQIVFIAGSDGTHERSALDETNCLDFTKTKEAFLAIGGLKPKQANAKMIELLQAEGRLVKQDNITHTVKCAERSGTPIEIIPTHQWFVKVTDKKDALKAKGNQCNWYPEFMHIRLNQWIEGLKEDWCISRQRFFGVPFPVWYISKSEGKVGSSTKFGPPEIHCAEPAFLPVDPVINVPIYYFERLFKNLEIIPIKPGTWIVVNNDNLAEEYMVQADTDVMDTWATSSVSPQINAHGISKELCADPERFARLFPADLRPQAHEIIRTWAFYTIVKAHLHEDSIPWKNLMISGWCLASDKTKMSKSKGNVVTPVDLIREKGADVVRYWASTSRLGADTAFSEDLLKIGKKLVTKLWNATAFAAIHLTKITAAPGTAAEDVADGRITETLDKWILSRLHHAVATATQKFNEFEYCDARVAVEEFFWKDFCDYYLELVKARAYGEIGDAKAHASAHYTLYHCLNTILRLFAPFLPHVTEELYSHLFDAERSIHARGSWPKAAYYTKATMEIEASGLQCMNILEAVRKAKSEKNVSIKFPIKEVVLAKGSKGEDFRYVEPILADLKAAGNIESIIWSDSSIEGNETENGWFKQAITFGEQTDAA